MTHANAGQWPLASIVLLMLVSACEQGDPLAPPTIRYGEDECAVCRMIISDDRYAAAAIVLDEDERYQPHAFDDIGCLFEFEAAQPDAHILARYVKDRQQRSWLDAESAELVHSRKLHTPMAFGIAAIDSLEAARAIHNEFGGDFIRLDEARRRFQAGMLHISSLDNSEAVPTAGLQGQKTVQLDDGRELHLTLRTAQVLAPGSHAFEVTVDGAGGEVHLRIEPEMPSMSHGSPGNAHPVCVADNLYRGQVNFTMAGPWVVHVSVLADDREIGRTFFAFEVQR